MRLTISQHWNNIQATLFPIMEEVVKKHTPKHYELIATLDFARVENFLKHFHGVVGRPEKDRKALACAFIAKGVTTCRTTRPPALRCCNTADLRVGTPERNTIGIDIFKGICGVCGEQFSQAH